MSYRLYLFALPLAAYLVVLASPVKSFADEKLFVDSKCAKCHSVSAANVETTKKSSKKKVPDLSEVTKHHDDAYLKSYLKKETAHQPHEGADGTKKHMTKFKGSDEELQKLIDWLKGVKK